MFRHPGADNKRRSAFECARIRFSSGRRHYFAVRRRVIFALECKLNSHTSDVQVMLITGSKGGARCLLLSSSSSSPSSRLIPSSFHPIFIFLFVPSPHFISPPSLASSSSSATLCLLISRRGAAVTGCRSRRHGNAWRCVCGCGSILSVVWRGRGSVNGFYTLLRAAPWFQVGGGQIIKY